MLVTAGTKLQYSAVPPTTYTGVAEVVDIDGPNLSVGRIDSSNQLTPAKTKTSQPGWVDLEELTAMVRYTSAEYTILLGLVGIIKTWQLLFPDSSTVTFPGYISKLSLEAPMEEDVHCPISIQPTGPVTQP